MRNRLFMPEAEAVYAAPRIVEVDVTRLNVRGYGSDNGYPQRMISMYNACPTAKVAAAKLADFIFGQGFSVPEGKTKGGLANEDGFWNRVLSSSGLVGDDLLEQIAKDYSRFENFAFQINYNALFQGVEVNYAPIEHVRKGIDERAGQWGVYDSWWVNGGKFGKYVRDEKIDWIDNFNPDPQVIKSQVSKAGGWNNYKGQLFVFNANYTLAFIDACLDSVEAEILARKTLKSNIKNNFGDKVIIMQPSEDRQAIQNARDNATLDPSHENIRIYNDMRDDAEATVNNWQQFVGTDGKQVVVAEYDSVNDKGEPVGGIFLKTIENKLDDKKFQFTINSSKAEIYGQYGQPAILHQDFTSGSVYNKDQYPQSVQIYNNQTEKDRIRVQKALKKSIGVVIPGLEKEEFNITPINDLTSATQNTDGANGEATQEVPDANQ